MSESFSHSPHEFNTTFAYDLANIFSLVINEEKFGPLQNAETESSAFLFSYTIDSTSWNG